MYDVYHIASETNATITDTCDIRDPNSLFAASHSRGKGRTETRQIKTLHHFKWSFFLFSLTQYVSSSQARRFCAMSLACPKGLYQVKLGVHYR